MLTCEDISFRYPDRRRDTLSGLSFTLKPGEKLAVMGANGSGKSTLARLLAGLTTPSDGRLVYSDGSEETGKQPEVGLLFQNPDNQMVSVLVDKEVAFALENRGLPMSEMAPRVTGTLDSFGIRHLAARLTMELSGGEKQRVALAGIMIDRPDILILDEADAFLDASGRQVLRSELDRIHRDIPDIIEVRITQSADTAKKYDRLILLENGRLAADGAPAEILSDTALLRRCRLHGEEAPARSAAVAQGKSLDSPVLTVEGLSFAFNGRQVLESASLSLDAGQIGALAGPTGSGKSTLALLLAGILKPGSGTISLNGSRAPRRRGGNVGLVLQQPERQFFLTTCSEEIAFGPENLGRSIDPEQVYRHLDEVGLDPSEFAERDPLSLSVGEKRRLAFAIMLALEPRVLVFDEPTAGLDPEGVGRFVRLVNREADRGRAILVITHDRKLIRSLAEVVFELPGTGELCRLTPDTYLATPPDPSGRP